MSSFEKVRPGISPRFLSQKMEQKEPEKKMPSTTAKAMRRSAKHLDSEIQRTAQLACGGGGSAAALVPWLGGRGAGAWCSTLLLSDARDGLDGVEEHGLLGGVLDVLVDEQAGGGRGGARLAVRSPREEGGG